MRIGVKYKILENCILHIYLLYKLYNTKRNVVASRNIGNGQVIYNINILYWYILSRGAENDDYVCWSEKIISIWRYNVKTGEYDKGRIWLMYYTQNGGAVGGIIFEYQPMRVMATTDFLYSLKKKNPHCPYTDYRVMDSRK